MYFPKREKHKKVPLSLEDVSSGDDKVILEAAPPSFNISQRRPLKFHMEVPPLHSAREPYLRGGSLSSSSSFFPLGKLDGTFTLALNPLPKL